MNIIIVTQQFQELCHKKIITHWPLVNIIVYVIHKLLMTVHC